jgi:hypothetical protein
MEAKALTAADTASPATSAASPGTWRSSPECCMTMSWSPSTKAAASSGLTLVTLEPPQRMGMPASRWVSGSDAIRESYPAGPPQ